MIDVHQVNLSSKLVVSVQNLYVVPSVHTYDWTASKHCFVCLFRWWHRAKGRRGTNRDVYDRWVETHNLYSKTLLLVIKETSQTIRCLSCVLLGHKLQVQCQALCASIFTKSFCFSSYGKEACNMREDWQEKNISWNVFNSIGSMFLGVFYTSAYAKNVLWNVLSVHHVLTSKWVKLWLYELHVMPSVSDQ